MGTTCSDKLQRLEQKKQLVMKQLRFSGYGIKIPETYVGKDNTSGI